VGETLERERTPSTVLRAVDTRCAAVWVERWREGEREGGRKEGREGHIVQTANQCCHKIWVTQNCMD